MEVSRTAPGQWENCTPSTAAMATSAAPEPYPRKMFSSLAETHSLHGFSGPQTHEGLRKVKRTGQCRCDANYLNVEKMILHLQNQSCHKIEQKSLELNDSQT